MITLDTETTLINHGVPTPVCLQVAREQQPPTIHTGQDLVQQWHSILIRPNILVGHRVAFDLIVLANHTNTLPQVFTAYHQQRVRDTYVRARLQSIARGQPYESASLAACVARYLSRAIEHEKKADPEVLAQVLAGDFTRLHELPPRYRFDQLRNLPPERWPEEFRAYAVDDVIYTRDIFGAQGEHMLTNEAEQVQADFVLSLMSFYGIRTDTDAVKKLADKLHTEYQDLRDTLVRAGVIKCRTITRGKRKGQVDERTDTKAVQGLVFDVLEQDAPVTATGRVATDRKTLQRAADASTCATTQTTLQTLVDISRPKKLLTTYVPVLESGTRTPINCRYSVLKASGRTSCSGPNMQNLPRDGGVRECFVPRPGCSFIGADYSAIEMVSLAQVLRWLGLGTTMMNALNEGLDPHLLMASRMLGQSYDVTLALYRAGDQQVKDLRQFAKIANYGYPGGMGSDSFVEYAQGFGLHIDAAFSAELRNGFLATWPEMPGYFSHIAALVGSGTGEVTQFVSNRRRGGCSYTQACNTYFQGLTADGAKRALWLVTLACYNNPMSPMFGYRPIIFVHDEIICEGPSDGANSALTELQRLMVAGMQPYMPDMVIRTEGKVMSRWTK